MMDLADKKSTWFVAQVKPNCARIASENLERQGFIVFLPVEEYTQRCRGRFINLVRPVFPGYIFVAVQASQNHWRSINSTYGITRIVSYGEKPAPVPKGLVEELMLRYDSVGKASTHGKFLPGDAVRVAKGPFSDFSAEIERIAPNRRVWVLLEIMGASTRVILPAESLRRQN